MQRRVIGIGLVALDIVIDEGTDERVGAWAGGSCGNVVSILSWMGWDAAPVARLDDTQNSRIVRDDLRRWDVDERWLSLGSSVPAPVYVERLRATGNGMVTHRFDRFCPSCGGRLPRYQPVVRDALAPVIESLERWGVLYVDRPSAGAVLLAQKARTQGLLVFFEPSARGTPAQLAALAAEADVVKYSVDRLTQDDRALIAAAAPTLEVETLGAAGLRYRYAGAWETVPPVIVNQADDTAGAGDWTTAGILAGLGDRGRPLERLSPGAIRDILTYAQALGAWSCGFRGPRGGMERHTAAQAQRGAASLLAGESRPIRRRPHEATAPPPHWVCQACP
jgi:fructokinase